MPSISLADIRKAADQKYGPYIVSDVDDKGDVTLLSPIRLSKAKRSKLAGLNEDESLDDEQRAQEVVKIAAKTPTDAKRLLDAFDGDFAQLVILVERYGKASQVGEA